MKKKLEETIRKYENYKTLVNPSDATNKRLLAAIDVFLVDLNEILKTKAKKERSQSKKILFSQSEIFDKQVFASRFREWSLDKCAYYYESAVTWSEEGNMKINWESTIKGWARRDALEGKIIFVKPKNVIESGLL